MYINRDKFNYFSPAYVDDNEWLGLAELGSIKAYHENSMVFEQSMRIHDLNCLLSGTVKIVHFFDNGNEKLCEQLTAPALIGTEALWNNGAAAYYPTVIAVSDIRLSSVTLEAAESYISERPKMIIALFQCIRNLMCIDRIRGVGSASMSLTQKAAFAIGFMQNADRDEEGYVQVTHEELAQLIGISRANVTTALTALTEKKLISKKRGRIKIIDPDALMELISKSD